MAKKVTQDDILQFNLLYYRTHNYAEVARQTGWSAGTVRRYIDPNFTPVAAEDVKHFYIEQIPALLISNFKGLPNFGVLCTHTADELIEIKELQKEIPV